MIPVIKSQMIRINQVSGKQRCTNMFYFVEIRDAHEKLLKYKN